MLKNKRIFYVNSRERIEGTDNSFSFKIDLDPTVKYDSVCILSCNIPKSYYLVQDGYNTLTLTEDDTSIDIVVPPGNYSRRSFQFGLITLLNNSSPKNWVYSITYPTSGVDTGKFMYAVSGNGMIQPTFTFPPKSSIYEQMGFDYNSSNTFIGDSLISTNVLKFQLENNLFIISDIVSGTMGNDVLLSLPCGFPDYSDITYETKEIIAQSRPLNTNNNNIYRFSLVNEDKQFMFLNGLNMTFTLMVYQRDDIYEMMRNYIKIRLLTQN